MKIRVICSREADVTPELIAADKAETGYKCVDCGEPVVLRLSGKVAFEAYPEFTAFVCTHCIPRDRMQPSGSIAIYPEKPDVKNS